MASRHTCSSRPASVLPTTEQATGKALVLASPGLAQAIKIPLNPANAAKLRTQFISSFQACCGMRPVGQVHPANRCYPEYAFRPGRVKFHGLACQHKAGIPSDCWPTRAGRQCHWRCSRQRPSPWRCWGGCGCSRKRYHRDVGYTNSKSRLVRLKLLLRSAIMTAAPPALPSASYQS